MKILLCHNYYQLSGGEDQVFEDERRLLGAHGWDVVSYTRHSADTQRMSRFEVARRTLWNEQTYREVSSLIRRESPALVHCTNIFPLLSPAVYDAARGAGIPVVQSLHNFRLLCCNSLFLHKARPCEACSGKLFPWPGLVRRCYRGSVFASAVMSLWVMANRRRRRNRSGPDLYLALSNFSRSRFVGAGFPPSRVMVKPNFVDPDPGVGDGACDRAVFVGRLSEEKGIDVLLDAWKYITGRTRLAVIGEGPMGPQVAHAAREDDRIEWLGSLGRAEVDAAIGEASCLILPSRCYENCPKTILEAYAKGTPVVASRVGSITEYVHDGVTGLLFSPGNACELAACVDQLTSPNEETVQFRENARKEYELRYTAEANYRMLLDAYARVLHIKPSALPGAERLATADIQPATAG